MQQDLFFRQQELAQSYQLGLLENEYVINPKKFLANFGLLLFIALLAPLMVLNLSPRAINSINLIIFSLIFFIAVGGGVILSTYRYYKHVHIYVYTNGLLYLNGNKSMVVLWQQMKRAYANKGYLNIMVNNAMPLSIPSYVARYGELRDRIKQEIASARNAG